ncbi:MAG: ferric reductase-like transmembrane domain-containing protein [Parcubacteria group bacterium]|jgi:hypothetical protein
MKGNMFVFGGKNKFILAGFILTAFFWTSYNVLAQNENTLDYGNSVVVDNDLDGLTDVGEKQIYQTDPQNPDSDGDGFLDGTEVIKNTNPVDATSPVATKIVSTQESVVVKEVPWAWYSSRAMGLMGYFLLWWVMFLGLAIRTPILNKLLKPIFSLEVHRWLSVQALFFALFHALVLLGDKFLQLHILDLFMPFYSQAYSNEITLGILGFYLMIMLIVTSYFRKLLSFRLWRTIHFLNIVLFVLVTIHAMAIGTDLKQGLLLRDIFLGANIWLVFIIVVNLSVRLKNAFFAQKSLQ